MAKKEMRNKKNMKKIIFIVGISAVALIALTVLIAFLVANNLSNSSSQKGLSLDDFYSADDCRCIERKMPACKLEGFEYNETRNLCVNSANKTVTYPTLSCSKYECLGVNYQYNFDDKIWEEK